MAGGRHKAIIDIVANVDSANKDIRSLKKELASTQKELDKLSKSKPPQPAPKKSLESYAEFAANLGLAYNAAVQLKEGVKQYGQEARRIEGLWRNQAVGIDQARKSTRGMVTDLDLLTLGNQAVGFGLAKSEKEFADYAKAADMAGRKVGMGPVEAMEALSASLGRGSSEMLDNLNIVLKKDQAVAQYAEQLGIAESAMTDVQKAEAFQVIGMQKVIESAESANEQMSEATVKVTQFGVAMENLENNVKNLPMLFGELATEVDHYLERIAEVPDHYERNESATEKWGSTFMVKIQAMMGAVFNLSGAIETVTDGMAGAQALWAGTTGTADMLKGQAGVARVKAGMQAEAQRQADIQAANRARTMMAAGGVLADQGVGTFFNVLGEAQKKGKPKRRGGRGGSRRQATANTDATAAIDIGAMNLESEAGILEREALAMERKLEIESLTMAAALESAKTEDERHALTMASLELQEEKQAEIMAKRLEAAQVMGDQAEVDAIMHEEHVLRVETEIAKEAELARAKEEQARRAKQARMDELKSMQAWANTSTSLIQGFGQTTAMAAQMAGASSRQQQLIAMKTSGVITMGKAVEAQMGALLAFASGNIPQGVALQGAAVFGFAQGGMLLAGQLPNGGGGASGGVGGGTQFASGRGVSGGNSRPKSSVPGSPTADSNAPGGGGGGGGSGGNTINVSVGNMYGVPDRAHVEDMARQINNLTAGARARG
jgi:hypothetical protein